jgi:hypothetical protein
MLRSLAETLPYSLLDLLGHNLRLKVLAQIFHVRGHAAPDLKHLPLYTLLYFAHGFGCPFTYPMFSWRGPIVRRGLESSGPNPFTPALARPLSARSCLLLFAIYVTSFAYLPYTGNPITSPDSLIFLCL